MTRCTSTLHSRTNSRRYDRASITRSREDYFRSHVGFRDNFERKSTLSFVSRIKFALLFFVYSTTSSARPSRFAFVFLFFSSSFIFILLLICEKRNERKRETERERRTKERWVASKLISARVGQYVRQFFASNQSNE